MASSVTITEQNSASLSVKLIKFDWTAHTDGVVSPVATTGSYTGKLVLSVTDPDGGTAPSDNYDITLADNQGVNVLVAAGTDRDTANVEQVLGSSLGAVVQSPLTFSVANAGSGGKGVLWVYIQ